MLTGGAEKRPVFLEKKKEFLSAMRVLVKNGAKFIREQTVYCSVTQFPEETGFRAVIARREIPMPNDMVYISEHIFSSEAIALQHVMALVAQIREHPTPTKTIAEHIDYMGRLFER